LVVVVAGDLQYGHDSLCGVCRDDGFVHQGVWESTSCGALARLRKTVDWLFWGSVGWFGFFLGVCLFWVFFEWADCYLYSVVFGGCAGCFWFVLGSCPEEAPSDDPEEDDEWEEHYDEDAFAHVFLLLSGLRSFLSGEGAWIGYSVCEV